MEAVKGQLAAMPDPNIACGCAGSSEEPARCFLVLSASVCSMTEPILLRPRTEMSLYMPVERSKAPFGLLARLRAAARPQAGFAVGLHKRIVGGLAPSLAQMDSYGGAAASDSI